MQVHVFVILHLEESKMGFVQKLASRAPRAKREMRHCTCCKRPLHIPQPKIPKLTLRYIFNLKNWK